MKKHTQQRGFALFLAVVVMSILLAASLATVDITVKELGISSSGRDSQYAFYAADAGIECALYWDFKPDPAQSSFKYSATPSQITCERNATHPENNAITVTKTSLGADNDALLLTNDTFKPIMAGYNVSRNTFFFTFAENYYTSVTVIKKTKPAVGAPGDADYEPERYRTKIESRGYNTSNTANPRRVERGIKMTY